MLRSLHSSIRLLLLIWVWLRLAKKIAEEIRMKPPQIDVKEIANEVAARIQQRRDLKG